MFSFRPNVLAIVSLCGNKSEVITLAPHLRAKTDRIMPIGPLALSPAPSLLASSFSVSIPFMQVLTGSINDACSNETPSAECEPRHPGRRSSPSPGRTRQSLRRWAHTPRSRPPSCRSGTARRPCAGSNSNRRTECDGTPSRDRRPGTVDTPCPTATMTPVVS